MIIIPPQEITVVSSNAATSPDADNPDYMFSSGMTDSEFLTTQTENPDLIEVEIGFDNCDRVALFNLDAYSVDFELTDDDTSTVVQTKSVDLEITGYTGEYKEWTIVPMHIYANATIKISINKLGGTAKCGQCGVGLSSRLGGTRYGAAPGFVDYSIVDEDEFGQTYLNQGAWAKRQEIDVLIDMAALDAVFEDLINVRGSIVYIDANNETTEFESLMMLGFAEDWTIQVNNSNKALLSLSNQGVI